MTTPRADLHPAHRIRVVAVHPVVNGRLDLGHRQRPPLHRSRGQFGVDRGPRLGVADQRGAIHDGVDQAVGNPSGGEYLGPPGAAARAARWRSSADGRPPLTTRSAPRPPPRPPHPNCRYTTARTRPNHRPPGAPPIHRRSPTVAGRTPRSPPAPTPPPHPHHGRHRQQSQAIRTYERNYPRPTTEHSVKPRHLSQSVDEFAPVKKTSEMVCRDGHHRAVHHWNQSADQRGSTAWKH